MLSRSVWTKWTLKLARFGVISLLFAALALITNVASAEASTLSGTLRDSLGNPVPGFQIQLTATNGTLFRANTASNGSYDSGNLPAGNYSLGFMSTDGSRTTTTPPGHFDCMNSCAGPTVNLSSGNVVQDLNMDLVAVTITLLDNLGLPMANTPIDVSGVGTTNMGAGPFTGATVSPAADTREFSLLLTKTNSLGNVTIYLPKGLTYAKVTAYPAAGGQIIYTALGSPSANTSITMQQLAPSVFHGILRDANGNPVSGQQISLYEVRTTKTLSSTTSASGAFNISVPAGPYALYYVVNPATGAAIPPGSLTNTLFPANIDLSAGGLTTDISFDLVPVTVSVTTATGDPIANTRVTASGNGTVTVTPIGQIPSHLSESASTALPKTDATGHVVIYIPRNMVVATVTALPVNAYSFTTTTSFTVTGPTSITLQQPPVHTFSGVFRDALGQAFTSTTGTASLLFGDTVAPHTALQISADSTGHFTASLPYGSFTLSVTTNRSNGPTAAIPPGQYRTNNGPIVIDMTTADRVQDIMIDSALVTVTVKDVNGNGIPNALVSADGSGNTSIFSPGGATNGNVQQNGGWVLTSSSGVASVYLPKGMTFSAIAAQASGSLAQIASAPIASVLTGNTSLTLQQTYVYSGVFRDGLGSPLPGVDVTLSNTSGASYTSRTNSSGAFSVATTAGTFTVSAALDKANSSATTAPPGVFTAGSGPSVAMTGNKTQNLSLPEAAVTVTARDSNGNPAANIPISATGAGTTTLYAGGDFANSSVAPGATSNLPKTNASGQATIYLPTNLTYSKVSAYFANSTVDYPSLGQLTGSASITIQQLPQRTFSGVFRDGLGVPAAGIDVRLRIPGAASASYSSRTAADGTFTVSAPAGNYILDVLADKTLSYTAATPPGIFATNGTGSQIDLTSTNITQDLAFDAAVATFHVIDSAGNPVVDVPVSATGAGSTSLFASSLFPDSSVLPSSDPSELPKTDSTGTVKLYLPKLLTYSKFTANFAGGNLIIPGPASPLTQDFSTTIRYIGPGVVTLLGKVSDNTGAPVANTVVDVINPATQLSAGTATTNSSGNYSLQVSPGTYAVTVTPPSGSGLQTSHYDNYSITADTTLNVTALPITSNLTGHITNGANAALAGVQVQVVDPANHATVLGAATTDASGNYTLGVTPGTYDVIITPTGDTYLPTTQSGVNLTSNTTLNVTLVIAPHTFSGTLKDRGGFGISGATIALHNAGGQTITATTGTSGTFSVLVNPAVYTLTITGSRAAAPLAVVPASFSLSGGSFDLSSDITQDLVINGAVETFTTKNAANGAVIGHVNLTVAASGNTTLYSGSGAYIGSSSDQVSTNGSGLSSIVLLTGSNYSVVATPPAGSGVIATTFPSTGPVTADENRDLALTADIKHFTGAFTDTAGTGIAGANIHLTGSLGSYSASTNAAGHFDISAAAGNYTLNVSGGQSTSGAAVTPGSFSFTGGSLDLSDDVQQNLTLGSTSVAVTAQSSFGAALPGTTITLANAPGTVSLYSGGSFTATTSSTAVTGANGIATLVVATGLGYTTKATPATGSGYLITNLSASSVVTADTAWTITLLRDLKTFAGSVKDGSGIAVANATVRLTGDEPDQLYFASTDNLGLFSLQAAPGNNYHFEISGSGSGATTATLPDNYSLTSTLSITGDSTHDITIDTASLDILARDNRLAAIPNVAIDFSSSGNQNGLSAASSHLSRTTGADGHAQLIVLKGTTYNLTATPPTGIGYVATSFTGNAPIISDTQAVIEFQNHIPLPPSATAPAATNQTPDIDWGSVDTATLYKIYRDNVYIGSSTTLTYVDGDATDGHHEYQVSAVSADGYESPLSNVLAVLVDTHGPSITNPSVDVSGSGFTITSNIIDSLSGIHVPRFVVLGAKPGGGDLTFDMGGGTGGAYSGAAVNLLPGAYIVIIEAEDGLGNAGDQIQVTAVILPTQPTGLAAPSPTNQHPVLTWNASNGHHYVIYRDGANIGTSATASFTDPAALADGSYSYAVSAALSTGQETAKSTAVNVLYDTTSPTVADPAFSVNPKNVSDTTVLSAAVSDTGSGISRGEYFQGTDAGLGNATSLSLTDGTLSATIGSNLHPGTYTFGIRAQDLAGNWSPAKTVQLVVARPNAPTNLQSPALTSHDPALTWTASADADKYFVYRGGAKIAETTTPGYTDANRPDGSYSYAVSAVNGLADESDQTAPVNVQVDKTAPLISYTTAPAAPNTAGWFNAPVTVTFACTDAGSGVANCPAPVTLSNDGTGQTASGTVTDSAGNSASLTTAPIKIDKTKPTITYALSSPANAGGWNNTDVTVTFTCADALSDLVSCTSPVTVGEGINQTITGTALDAAGNTDTLAVVVSVDKTKPTIAAAVTPLPNAAGWNNANAVVSFSCLDALSGIATCSAPVTVSSETAAQTVTGSATDHAGNSASVSTTVKLDKTLPTISYTAAPAPNAAGWNKANVVVTFTCTDALSGLASCTSPVTVSADGNQQITGTAVDNAGNVKTISANVKLDKTIPIITYTINPAPNAAGWNRTNATVTFNCTDPTSGIASCSGPTTVTIQGANRTVTGTATDNAGNTATITATVKLDKTAPATPTGLTMNPNPLVFTNNAAISANATDTLSGVAGGEYYLDTDPGQGSGTAMTYAAGKISATAHITGLNFPSQHILYVRSRDAAGNWSATTSVLFTYAYLF